MSRCWNINHSLQTARLKSEILSTLQMMLEVVLWGRQTRRMTVVMRKMVDGVGRRGAARSCRSQGGNGRREKIFLSSEKLFNSSDWKVWKVFKGKFFFSVSDESQLNLSWQVETETGLGEGRQLSVCWLCSRRPGGPGGGGPTRGWWGSRRRSEWSSSQICSPARPEPPHSRSRLNIYLFLFHHFIPFKVWWVYVNVFSGEVETGKMEKSCQYYWHLTAVVRLILSGFLHPQRTGFALNAEKM